ncbi:MAG TPA: cytochrome c oxidase subunit II [Verrucomicrobiae bacterium]|jgi:cytochrome c oxidase subunit II|nr:cytochrome c oxidase subunit II [Verrucomicrobiae bacterium]
MFPLWPISASTMSGQVDALYIFLIAVTGTVTALICILVLVFIFRYRHSKHPVAEQVTGSIPLELTWSLVSLGIFMIFFLWGANIYVAEATPPKDSLQIYIVAKQWMWKTQHENGEREINALHVPVNRDVRLTMISQDVIHSFWVPEFRIKADVLPGRYTTLWFRANRTGTYHLFCAEYCGTLHSGMLGKVVVLDDAKYQQWVSGGGEMGSFAATGQKLFQQLGCANCHRFDTQGRGPNLVGVYGKPVLLGSGRSVIADDAYIRQHILNPGSKVVAGFKPIMPSFQGIVTEDQTLSLIAYIKSLATPEQREPVSNRPPVPKSAGAPEVQ